MRICSNQGTCSILIMNNMKTQGQVSLSVARSVVRVSLWRWRHHSTGSQCWPTGTRRGGWGYPRTGELPLPSTHRSGQSWSSRLEIKHHHPHITSQRTDQKSKKSPVKLNIRKKCFLIFRGPACIEEVWNLKSNKFPHFWSQIHHPPPLSSPLLV